MKRHALVLATLVVVSCSSERAFAEGLVAMTGGVALPTGSSSDFLSQGFEVGLTYDWNLKSAVIGLETGFSSLGPTDEYEAYLEQVASPVEYTLTGIPLIFHVRVPLLRKARTVPYLVGGMGLWRLTEGLFGFNDVHTQAGFQLGAGLNQTFSGRIGMGVEGLYQSIQGFVPRIAATDATNTQWVTLRVRLSYATGVPALEP